MIIDWLVVQGSIIGQLIDYGSGEEGKREEGKKTKKNKKAHVGFPKVGGGILGQRSYSNLPV